MSTVGLEGALKEYVVLTGVQPSQGLQSLSHKSGIGSLGSGGCERAVSAGKDKQLQLPPPTMC